MLSQHFRKVLLAGLVLLAGVSLSAQNRTVRGVITDAAGPVIGATVMVENTTNGVSTDVDGSWSLSNVPANANLVFSCIGYITQIIPVGNQSVINVTLVEDNQMIEETVVVGYGVQRKSDVTGSISSVKAEEISNTTATELGAALQGKISGLQILSSSGAPGSGSTFRIRGYSSNGSSNPLYIVDGLKVRDINYLDVESIESIEVLKDAASAAIYGAEAGNGVVLITTKSAKNTEGRVFYNGLVTMQTLANFPDVMNAEQYLQYQDQAGNANVRASWDGKTDTDWAKEVFETGLSHRHTVGFQNGNDKSSLYIALTLDNTNGMVWGDKDTFKRLTGQVNASQQIKKWLTVTSNTSFEKATSSFVRQQSESGSAISSVLLHDPITPVFYTDANMPDLVRDRYYNQGKPYITDAEGHVYGVSQVCESQNYNPFIDIAQQDAYNERLNVNGTLAAILTPVRGLTFTSRLGYRIGSTYDKQYTAPFYVNELRAQATEYLSGNSGKSLFYQWENFANYLLKLGDHNLTFMAGMSYEENNTSFTSADTYSLSSTEPNYRYLNYSTADANDTIGGVENRSANISYFGRIGWNWKDRYNVQVNFRADAFDTSKLSKKTRWGYFPSVSAGWTVSNEPFWKNMNLSAVNSLKVRASYGINGNVNALSSYAYTSSLSTGNNYNLHGGSLGIGTYPGTTLANPDLKWEESRQVDLGIDVRMFKDRLSFSVDYYSKNTEGLLVSTTPALSTGTSSVYKNAGRVHNDGLEFELSYKGNFGDFRYNISGNFSTLHNKVTVGPATNRLPGAAIQSASTITYFEEGYPVWYLRGWKIDHIEADGTPYYQTANGGSSTAPTDADKTYLGSAVPDFTYGINLAASWKNFDLTVFGSGVHGNELYLAVKRGDYSTLNGLTLFLDEAGKTLPSPAHQITTMFLSSDGMVFDASYFRLSRIQLAYNFPRNLLKKTFISNLKCFVQMENVLTLTKYPGMDPETRTNATSGMAVDRGSYPSSRRTSFGINVSF